MGNLKLNPDDLDRLPIVCVSLCFVIQIYCREMHLITRFFTCFSGLDGSDAFDHGESNCDHDDFGHYSNLLSPLCKMDFSLCKWIFFILLSN